MMPTRSFIVCCSSLVQGVRVLAARPASNGAERRVRGGLDVRLVDAAGRWSPSAVDVAAAPVAGAPAEDQQVGQRVAAEPVGAVHAAGHLAGREQARARGRGAGVGVDLDAAHDVVAGRADLHRLLGDVDVGQLLELVVHRRQPLDDLLGGQPGGDVRNTPPCGEPRPALTSELMARATSSRGSSSGGRRLLSGSLYQRSPSSSVSAYCALKTSGT